MIFKINKDKYVRYNPETDASETIDVTELEARKEELEGELKTKTDAELLDWAKANYFTSDMLSKIERDTKELEKIDLTLNEIYGD